MSITYFAFEFPAESHFEFLLRHMVATIVKKQLSFVCINIGNRMTSKKIQDGSVRGIQKQKYVVFMSSFFGTLKLFNLVTVFTLEVPFNLR